ncbi:uncharacterized protein [Venturia canescens]|uniref:uncharacterized protein n=1 Tax=Venturia canescens TaxID=32260 RepID=UPI001C9C6D5F|nr:uncharacterized protein LOC122411883 [Venturia canescens]
MSYGDMDFADIDMELEEIAAAEVENNQPDEEELLQGAPLPAAEIPQQDIDHPILEAQQAGDGQVAQPQQAGDGPIAEPQQVGVDPVAQPQQAGDGPVTQPQPQAAMIRY